MLKLLAIAITVAVVTTASPSRAEWYIGKIGGRTCVPFSGLKVRIHNPVELKAVLRSLGDMVVDQFQYDDRGGFESFSVTYPNGAVSDMSLYGAYRECIMTESCFDNAFRDPACKAWLEEKQRE